MLSHEPEVSRLLYHERMERLADDAQQPMASVSLPSPVSAAALSRVAGIARVALAVRPRRLYSRA